MRAGPAAGLRRSLLALAAGALAGYLLGLVRNSADGGRGRYVAPTLSEDERARPDEAAGSPAPRPATLGA